MYGSGQKKYIPLCMIWQGDSFVRIIPFNNHINIEAKAVIQHKEELAGYKITPKGMLQIDLNQDIPHKVLKQIFAETLE